MFAGLQDSINPNMKKPHKTFLAKIQELSVDKEMRQIPEIKLELSQKADQDHAIL